MSVENNQAPQGTPNAPVNNDSTIPAQPPVSTEDKIYGSEKPAEATKQEAQSASAETKPEEQKQTAGGEDKPPAKTESGDKEGEAPKDYELALPKDSMLTDDQFDKISSFAKEKGLSKEQAQSLVDRESKQISDYYAQHAERVSGWKKAIETDKELGGEKYKESVEFAHRALDRYGSQSLKDELEKTGLGNHPEMVRVFARIGRQMSEDSLVVPGTKSGQKKSIEDIFYGNNQ